MSSTRPIAGDPHARALREGLARGVAAAVRVLVLTADVDVVVLGGGLTALGDRLIGDVRRELEASAASSAFLRSLRLDERVELLAPESPAAALGAALVGATLDPEAARAWLRSSSCRMPPPPGSIVADEIVRLIRHDPETVLGLATGSTPASGL